MKAAALILIAVFILNFAPLAAKAQTRNPADFTFEEIEILLPSGNDVDEKSVRVEFTANEMLVTGRNSAVQKTFRYADIKSAEYSYSKNPRWKTGLGLGAASVIFPPLILIALPLGFSKHRRHWLTVRTGEDYAVLKLSKSSRKLFIPAFETKSGVRVRGVGEDK